MIRKISAIAVFGALLATGFGTGTANAASPNGNWKRPNGDTAKVYNCGGNLCGKIVKGNKAGLEMLNGMAKIGSNSWAGKNMKHPDMPGFMTFNGTVVLSGNSLSVKGCALGKAMCDKEVWTRAQ